MVCALRHACLLLTLGCVCRLSCCRHRWFNAGTRAILFQMTFYNTNTKQLTNLRLLFEVFMSGQILPSYQFDTAKIVVYQSRTDEVGVPSRPLAAVAETSPPPARVASSAQQPMHPSRHPAPPLSALPLLIAMHVVVVVVGPVHRPLSRQPRRPSPTHACCFQLRLLGEVVLVLFFIYYLQKELRSLRHYKPPISYFMHFANVRLTGPLGLLRGFALRTPQSR